jgi:pyruvate/2-oxoglutarate dehydrogenase complex dihydrolipoamide dehydrogenase (E3) component
MAEQCEVLVIGGGGAGYTAASTAARLGKRVAMAERGKLGETCRDFSTVFTIAQQSLRRCATFQKSLQRYAGEG